VRETRTQQENKITTAIYYFGIMQFPQLADINNSIIVYCAICARTKEGKE
jgi:hypothetical protein